MNVVPLEKPTARPPIQMKSPKKRAQRNAVTPGAIEGERRCIAGNPTEAVQKKFTEPVALLSTSPGNFRLPPTALGSGFDLLALRARCKRKPTGPDRPDATVSAAKSPHFAHSELSTFPRPLRRGGDNPVDEGRSTSNFP